MHPDTVRGLKRLKKRCIIATLSNGDVALLTNDFNDLAGQLGC